MKRRADSATVLFDVTYVDGTLTSRRKVLKSIADGEGGDAASKAAIEAQDREIASASGRNRGEIRSIVRSST